MIKIEKVYKTYKSNSSVDTQALKDINLSFGDTGFVFIIGKSGSGKTTLLNMIGSLDTPDSGSIIVDNLDICNMKTNMAEAYRNTYVGFVFQEFNLLEEFNVYENINISLELNKQSNSKRVNEVLKDVDLEGLGNRKINELSGGQKQRVSIARAIVKNPKLILADEPTGNLDKKSSEQVLKILKKISKDHLVIVVSHDIESAEKYADRIIRIEDGEVTSDSNNKIKSSDKNIQVKSSRLPLSYMFKMANSYTMARPVRLVLTILLTMIALSFMCFSINTYLFDNTSLLINTMKDNNINNLKIEHYNVEFDDTNRIEKRLPFTDIDIDYIEEVSNSIVNPAYSLNENGNSLSFSFGTLSDELLENDAYSYIPTSFRYIVLNDRNLFSKIIGNYPQSSNEILVHKYFADTIINAGIYNTNNELYKPSSYNEIINSNEKIRLGNNEVIISGIVDDDTSKFERAFKSGTFWDDNLKNYYNENYLSYGSHIYVTNDFIDNIMLSESINTSNLQFVYNNMYGKGEIKALNGKIDYIDLNGNKKEITSLNKDEVIISLDIFDSFISNYKTSLSDYLKTHSNMVYNDIVINHLKEFLKNNEIDNKISLVNPDNEGNDLTIVGINLETNYISDKYEANSNSKKNIEYLIIHCENKEDLENIFDSLDVLYTYNYFLDGNKYRVSYNNSRDVSGVIYVYSRFKQFLLSVSIIFVVFSMLLIYNFISTSIDSYKKEIGILRSIGTRNIDIIKIFIIESLFIGILSWIFGTFIWIGECIMVNNYLFGSLYFKLQGVIINPVSALIVLIFDILLSIMLTASVINKINKIKPIDVILNRYE